MNIEKYEKSVMDALSFDYQTPYTIHKKTGLNWFIAFGTLCMLALNGKIDVIKTERNYVFKKFEEEMFI